MQATTYSRRGGARDGAGRKRATENRQDPRHEKRETLECRYPVHAMLRTREDVPRLRQRKFYEAIRRVLRRYVGGRFGFRVIHISIQHNHLHLIVEAGDEMALTRGMQSFAINAARAINRACGGRAGKVFKFRYKAKQIRTRSYARNALSYVLNNWRRHREDLSGNKRVGAALDRYSSAISFDGWARSARWAIPDGYQPLPVSAPTTHLLKSEWQWHGLIDPREVPGPH